MSPATIAENRRYAWGLLGAVHAVTACVFLFSRSSGTAAALTGFPLDDSWIHFVYARSFSSFEGFAYNPGVQEAGFTSPLWVVLLSVAFWLKPLFLGNVVIAAKLLCVAFAWLTSGLAYELVRKVSKLPAAAVVVGVLIALDPALGFAKVSGMEVSLSTASLLTVLLALAARSPVWIGVTLALAPLARPENALLCVLAAPLALFVVAPAGKLPRARDVAAILAPAVVAGAAWVGFCLAVTGRPLPNTFYAKHPGGLEFFVHNFETEWTILLSRLPWFRTGTGVVLLAIGASCLLRATRPSRRALLTVALMLTFPLVFTAGIAWSHLLTQGEPFYWYRYFQPCIPLLLIPFGVGLHSAALFIWGKRRSRTWQGRAVVLATAVIVTMSVITVPADVGRSATVFSENCEDINQSQVAIGRWLADYAVPGELIATGEAGALRYFSERPILDLGGLNNHEVLAQGRDAILARERPRLFVNFPHTLRGISASRGVQAVFSVRDEHYTICDCPKQEELVVYEVTFVPPRVP